jgi:hypothetical protein
VRRHRQTLLNYQLGPASAGSGLKPCALGSCYNLAKHHSISNQSRPALSHACHCRLAGPGARAIREHRWQHRNDEKSLSGSRETSRAAEPSKPARRSKPDTEAPSRGSRKSGGGGNGGGSLDGAWVLTSIGSPCGTSSDTVVITGSRMVGQQEPFHRRVFRGHGVAGDCGDRVSSCADGCGAGTFCGQVGDKPVLRSGFS